MPPPTLHVSFDLARLTQDQLPAASEVIRLAFATFMGAADPSEFWNDRDYVRSRWRARHTAWFQASCADKLVGVVCVTRWGSNGVLGPLAVLPAYWQRQVAKRLMDVAVEQLDRWGVHHAGLFTFADSPKHLGLYQHYGFWPQTLNAVMTRPVGIALQPDEVQRYGADPQAKAALRAACEEITDAIDSGLQVSGELDAVLDCGLGTTLILTDGVGLVQAFAVCHFGPNSEAGSDVFYVKFAAVRPGPEAPQWFARMFAACEAAAHGEQLATLMAGVNTARRGAYQWLLAQGFRSEILGITMHRGGSGYDRANLYLIDDWR